MFALRGLLAAAATLVGVVAAAQNSSAVPSVDGLLLILEKLPTCVQTCSLGELANVNCQLADIRNCLCTNSTMQAALASCVLNGCNVTEQAIAFAVVALTVSQQDICVGIPQPSRSNQVIQSTIIISAITFPIIALRCLSRYLVARRIWWDDWLIVLCAIFLVPMTVFPILNATKGFGKHIYDVPPDNIIVLRQLYYVSQIFYTIVHPVAKISILLLYLRIFPDERFQRMTKISLTFMLCHLVAFTTAITFQCSPVKRIWDQTIPGTCTDIVLFIYIGAGFSIFEDLVIILLPIPQLKMLNLTLRKRIALVFMFSLGSFACITSMIRLKYIFETESSVDLTWDYVDLTIWSIIEVFSAVICSCLISLRPLLVRYFPKLLPATQHSANFNSAQNPNWNPRLSSKLTGKLQSGNRGVELLSEDEMRDRKVNFVNISATHTASSIELNKPASSTKQTV